jgi:hypothetical protein
MQSQGAPQELEPGDVVFVAQQVQNTNDLRYLANLAEAVQGLRWHHVGIAGGTRGNPTLIDFGPDPDKRLPWGGGLAERAWSEALDGRDFKVLRVRQADGPAIHQAALEMLGRQYALAAIAGYALASQARMFEDSRGRENLLFDAWGAATINQKAGTHTCVSAVLEALDNAGVDLGSFTEPAPRAPSAVPPANIVAITYELARQVCKAMQWTAPAPPGIVPDSGSPKAPTVDEIYDIDAINSGWSGWPQIGNPGSDVILVKDYLNLLIVSTRIAVGPNTTAAQLRARGTQKRDDDYVDPWLVSTRMLYERLVDVGAQFIA